MSDNPSSEQIKDILTSAKTIAVVGLSDKPDRDSYKVAAYLKRKGYRIIPVNPAKEKILEETSYPDLKSIAEKIDIVDIFRNIEAIPEIADEAIAAGAKTIWMQIGLSHEESAQKARNAGINVVQLKCIKVEHAKLIG